jgi:hypothetical protein
MVKRKSIEVLKGQIAKLKNKDFDAKVITAKIKRIEDGEEKPDDRTLLRKAYQSTDVKRLFKAKGLDLDSMLKGIIG